MEKATQRHTKEHNRNLVLKTIFENDPISRADIARKTFLTRTTVSDIVFDLLGEGLVREIGIGPSLVGKSPILLGLVEDSRCVIGLDLAQNQFTGALVNLKGKIQRDICLPANDRYGDDALSLVYQMVDQLVAVAGSSLIGIGVGTPGLVNNTSGVVINAVNLGWQNLPLAHLLSERYHLPVSVLNDSQAAAIGEYTYGRSGHNCDHLVVINARHGIGSGIVIQGKLFQGQGGSAGEVGHIVVVPVGGLPCRCGNHGCLETVASAQALIRRAQSLAGQFPATLIPSDPQWVTLESILMAFNRGDPLAQQLVLETARYLGVAIANLHGILNIQNIVLTGDMTRFGHQWLEVIREVMNQFSLGRSAQGAYVEIGQLGANGIILGASAMLINDYSLLFTHASAADS